MPSNAELAKRLEQLENILKAKLYDVVGKVTDRAVSKFNAEPSIVVTELKKTGELKASLSFLNDTAEALKTENEALKEKNKTLKALYDNLKKDSQTWNNAKEKTMLESMASRARRVTIACRFFKPLVLR